MNKILRSIIHICSSFVFVLFILSITGLVSNNRGSSFGFAYRTDYTCFLLTLALTYTVVSNGWLTWFGELSFIALDVYILLIGGKTSFICLTLMIVILMVRHLRRNGGVPFQDKDRYGLISTVFKFLYIPIVLTDRFISLCKLERIKSALLKSMIFCFPGMALINYALIFTYKPLESFWSSIGILSTFKDRLIYGMMGFNEYPLTLFGTDIPITDGTGESFFGIYYVLDSVYMRFLLQCGVIPFILVLLVLTAVQVFNYKRRHYIGLTVVFIYSLSFLMEFSLQNLAVTLAFLTVSLFYERPGIQMCDKLSFSGWSSAKRRILCALTLGFLVVFFVWCSTAYKISSWRGWTPVYDATLVIPGEFLNADNDLLEAACEYLDSHSESFCIVSDDAQMDRLLDMGIAEERIYVSESNDIDEMLINARNLIDTNGLPPRLTICTYGMQQARIGIHAKKLEIPVNSIAVKPENGYLIRFSEEQWRLICGK